MLIFRGHLPLMTERLLLRRLEESDGPAIRVLAEPAEVALMTAQIPHPYPAGVEDGFIRQARAGVDGGSGCHLGIERRADGLLIGLVSLTAQPSGAASLGYLVGRPWWGQGYASEAAAALIAFAVRQFGLRRIEAQVLAGNAASARVLRKCGFTCRGRGVTEAPARGGPREVELYCYGDDL